MRIENAGVLESSMCEAAHWEVHNIEDFSREQFESATALGAPVGLRREFVISFCEGQKLPLSLLVKGEFMECVIPDAELIVKRTLYLRMEGEELLFSADLSAWKSAKDFFTGSIGFMTEKESSGSAHIGGQLELNMRRV